MTGGDGITLPPVERPAVPEPVEKPNRDRERNRDDRKGRKKKPPSEEPDKPAPDGKGERVDIRA